MSSRHDTRFDPKYQAYLRSLAVDEPFIRQTSLGNEHYHGDALGSSLALSNAQGGTGTTYSYEPFGKTQSSSPSFANSFQFTGRENDGTGLLYYRARYYSTNLQRFISEDPLEYESGENNLYIYARNNPLLFNDPWGLKIDLSKIGRLKDSLDKVKRTKRGKELYDILDQSKKTYKIREREPGDPSPAFYNPKTNEIVVDPSFNPTIQTTNGNEPASTPRILGHEMGHAATGDPDTGPAPGLNTINNENPIANELGQNSRVTY